MSSLQKYKGTGRNASKTYYKKQFYLPDGRRATIRLGALSLKNAREFSNHIDHLINSKKYGTKVEEKTEAWLRDISDVLRASLVKYDLAKNFADPTILEFVDKFIKSRADVAERTIVTYKNARRHLVEYFEESKTIASVTNAEARGFYDWILNSCGLGQNTAKRRTGIVRQFFTEAVEQEVITKNPFKQRSIVVSIGAAKKEYVAVTTIERVIEACTEVEWKLLFAFARFVGCRMPSEIENLRWSDINWAENTILLQSPKTARKGKPERLVPIFVELEQYLLVAYDQAKKGGHEFVFNKIRHHSNLRKATADICESAGVKPWPKFFNSLRASCETDLMDRYGLRRACAWIGNSPDVAMKNYALLKKTDFFDVGESIVNTSGAKAGAEPARFEENDEEQKSQTPSIPDINHPAPVLPGLFLGDVEYCILAGWTVGGLYVSGGDEVVGKKKLAKIVCVFFII